MSSRLAPHRLGRSTKTVDEVTSAQTDDDVTTRRAVELIGSLGAYDGLLVTEALGRCESLAPKGASYGGHHDDS